jgi:hypothetical protein
MAAAGCANFIRDTLEFGQWIATEARKTTTNARSVIFDHANGIITAAVLLTNVEALVAHSVAQLRWWAVFVVHARCFLAALGQVTGVAKVSLGTVALGDVVLGHAHGAISALCGAACSHAFRYSLWFDANFRFRALSIGDALINVLTSASQSIVDMTFESGQARALTAVVFSNAERILWAVEFGADRQTLEYTQIIGSTRISLWTLAVVRAVWQWWLLASRCDWIPDEEIVAVAHRSLFIVNFAFFIFAARNGFTSAEFWHASFDLTALVEIVGASFVAAIETEAARFVLGSDANGIWSALQLCAAIDTLSRSAAVSEANFRLTAVLVGVALTAGCASLCLVVWISKVSLHAHALAALSVARRVGSALFAIAQIFALTSDAFQARWTEHVGVALAVSRRLANVVLGSCAHDKRISHVLVLTLAVEGAHGVDANGILTANLRGAFIDVVAVDVGISVEARLALTLDRCRSVRANCVLSTARFLALSHLGRLAALVGISECSSIAHAVVFNDSVLAMSARSASRLTRWHRDGWHADGVGMTDKVLLADTLSSIRIAHRSHTAHDALALLLATALDADQRRITWSLTRALVDGARTSGKGIAELTRWTLTRGPRRGEYAKSALRTVEIVTR